MTNLPSDTHRPHPRPLRALGEGQGPQTGLSGSGQWAGSGGGRQGQERPAPGLAHWPQASTVSRSSALRPRDHQDPREPQLSRSVLAPSSAPPALPREKALEQLPWVPLKGNAIPTAPRLT